MQFPKKQLPKSILAAALGPHSSLRCLRGPKQTFGKLPLGKFHIWKVAPLEVVTWEVSLGKVPVTDCILTDTKNKPVDKVKPRANASARFQQLIYNFNNDFLLRLY